MKVTRRKALVIANAMLDPNDHAVLIAAVLRPAIDAIIKPRAPHADDPQHSWTFEVLQRDFEDRMERHGGYLITNVSAFTEYV